MPKMQASVQKRTDVSIQGKEGKRDSIVNGKKLVPPAQISEQRGTGREAGRFVGKPTEFRKHSLREDFSGADTGADVGKFANE